MTSQTFTFAALGLATIISVSAAIAGHGRVAAAKQLGLSTVPTLAISHLSDIQIRAYRIADNQLAELAGWDEALLALEFAELETLETIDLDVTGFDLPNIDLMIQGLDREADPEDTLAPEPDIATVVAMSGGSVIIV